jgi:hypothetical protein
MALEDPYAPFSIELPLDRWGFAPPTAPVPPDQVTAAEYGLTNLPPILPPMPAPPAPSSPPPPPAPPAPPPAHVAAAIAPNANEVPAGAVPPDAPPQLGEMPPEYVGPGAQTPVPALPGVPALPFALGDQAQPPPLPPPPTDPNAALPAPPAPDAAADPQLAMYGVPSVPAPTTVDAVSDAGATPPADALSPEKADEQQQLYYATHPFARARDEGEAQAAAQQQARTEKLKADAADQTQAATNLANVTKARQDAAAARAQAEADAKKIATVDPAHWMNSSTYNSVTGVIAAALGGLGQMQNGGRNIGLEQLNKNIDRDIEAQQVNIQKQRADISQRLSNTAANVADSEANYIDQEKYRAGVYQRAMDEIQTRMQDYDPRGSTNRALGAQYAAIAGAQQISLDKIGELDFNRRIKTLETVGKYTEQMAGARKSIAEAAKLEAKLGAGEGPTLKPYGVVYPSLNEVPPKLVHLAFALPTGGVILASNEKNAEQAAALGEAYKAADVDLNRMQQIAIERNNARSAGGQVWSHWKDTGEHEFDQLVIDFANTYGTTIHGGRPIPAGTLDEVMKVMPELKGVIDGGDTVKEIDNFRNDFDNRMAGKFTILSGSKVELKSDRPKPVEVNANTLVAGLRAKPVKGASGYASMDVGEANKQLDAIAQHYQQNPTLGGNKGLASEYDNIDATQHKAVSEISGDLAKLQAVKKRSAQQEQQLKNNRKALADRQEVIKAIDDARKRHADVMGDAAKAQGARIDEQVNSENAAHKRFGDF